MSQTNMHTFLDSVSRFHRLCWPMHIQMAYYFVAGALWEINCRHSELNETHLQTLFRRVGTNQDSCWERMSGKGKQGLWRMLDNTNSKKRQRIGAGDGRTGRAEEFWDKVIISHGAHLSRDIIRFVASFIKEGQKYTLWERRILYDLLYYINIIYNV